MNNMNFLPPPPKIEMFKALIKKGQQPIDLAFFFFA
jgi:hypothetical protein